jgi:ERCC4-related helicase
MQTAYHAKYFASELTKRCSSDSIEKFAVSLSEAQVDLNPHQVEAALFAFRSPLSKGAILADEVGLGKTIEAGILLSQKWAERKRKILIIVPANLRKQWNQELLDKFFLPSIILEAKSFNQEIKQGKFNPFEQDKIIICSYQFAATKDSYIKNTRWDLVVIDEAHRLRNVYKPQNKTSNKLKNAVMDFNKILLTATPLQNSLMELYGLVSIIDDFTFGDLKSFKSQFTRLGDDYNFEDLKARLKPICHRTLRRQVNEYVPYTNRICITQEFIPTEEEQRLYDLVSDYLQSLTLFALPASQRHLMTLILRKLLASSTYAITGTLEGLAKKLENIVENHNNGNLEDQINEEVENFDEIKEEWSEDIEEDLAPVAFTDNDIKAIKSEISSLKEFHKLSKSIIKNSKGEVLLTALKKGFEKAQELGANKKALIFTESTRTQEYLRNILENTEHSGKVVLFNGSNTDEKSKEIYKKWVEKYKGTDRVTGSATADKRAAIIDYFREEAEIMIATEAAAEGVNLQFCSMLVNYDLPWNPQRIEQRIGRCHRYGQKYDVVVVNFLNKKNAADQRVYELLKNKFSLFSGVFGTSDEVLGIIESGIDFEKRIVQIYQTCRTEEEIQQSFDELQKKLEEDINEKMLSTRQKLLENFDEEVREKLRDNLSKSTEYIDKYHEWLWKITKFTLNENAEFFDNDYSFILKNPPFKDIAIQTGKYKIGKNIDDAHIYRIGHPLAQQILEYTTNIDLKEKFLIFDYSNTPIKISILEDFISKSGWLCLKKLTVSSFEDEDYIILSAFSDDGTVLDSEQSKRLFSLPAKVCEIESLRDINSVRIKLDELFHGQKVDILQENAEKNAEYFDLEMEKLDKWAEDVKKSLEIELKNLEKEVKMKKTESRKILKLEEKLQERRKITEMEKRCKELQKELYQAQTDVENKKESLIDEIEAKLKQKIEENELFLIKWRLI